MNDGPPSLEGPRATFAVLAALSGVALASASILPMDPPGLVPCGFLNLTGHPCPFCGTTRAFTAMGHGAWTHAAAGSPLGAVLYVLTAATFVACLVGAFRPARIAGLRRFGADLSRRRWFWVVAAGFVAANWIYRLAAGLK
jgi:hypothetical protein